MFSSALRKGVHRAKSAPVSRHVTECVLEQFAIDEFVYVGFGSWPPRRLVRRNRRPTVHSCSRVDHVLQWIKKVDEYSKSLSDMLSGRRWFS